ncbi:MAG: ribbon-helix-helix protein, CopG family [Leucobacter sp.]
MAMTVRLPEELDAKLEQIAAARHSSKHAVLLAAAERFVSEELKTALVLDAVERVGVQYAEAIQRLEDA